MAVLRARVKCFRCGRSVDKTQTLITKSITKDIRYECAKCYKRNKTSPWGLGDEIPHKIEYFCERCKYKFKSKVCECPYCNKRDRVTEARITVSDLL
ncbi:MAG: hypothetical protein ABH824_05035 [Nanoarchaeota archaeon]|nr:hypothetical protein [Nanoarchaeota archaeon]MBU1632470.1 hypothetical protein [Nanoarchaeota archaeon]MBU1876457.1 hypothetical protein [Nanoarchaeota archaeon]